MAGSALGWLASCAATRAARGQDKASDLAGWVGRAGREARVADVRRATGARSAADRS